MSGKKEKLQPRCKKDASGNYRPEHTLKKSADDPKLGGEGGRGSQHTCRQSCNSEGLRPAGAVS